METFCNCGHIAKSDGLGTGYGIDKDGNKICYYCCGENDKQELRNTGKLFGYISKNKDGKFVFTNWPGSFVIPVYSFRYSWHNFAGKNGRLDFWLNFEGNTFHGVNIGKSNQCATIKKTKK